MVVLLHTTRNVRAQIRGNEGAVVSSRQRQLCRPWCQRVGRRCTSGDIGGSSTAGTETGGQKAVVNGVGLLPGRALGSRDGSGQRVWRRGSACLLYTSDAADEL